MRDTSEVARKLWSLCNILRDEGVTYHEYLNELTYLLFLKLAAELRVESTIPHEYRWQQLKKHPRQTALEYYRSLLDTLGTSSDSKIKAIYSEANTTIQNSRALVDLIAGIDAIDWYRARQNGLGDVYEGLIEKNAQESRYGSGQYFTPRSVVDALVHALNPAEQDTVYDPAAGTGGFLVAAGLHARDRNGNQAKLRGVELVKDVHRMSLMNLILHDLWGDITYGDALTYGPPKEQVSVCLTNPPFGVKGGLNDRQMEQLEFPTSNKQLAFLQHAYMSLAREGRAAIVLPDNVLYEDGVALSIRRKLMQDYRLHTLLHLPTGIFYATGIRTTVLFFSAGATTTETWFYDLRNGNGTYGKRRQLTSADLQDFLDAYGSDPHGTAERTESPRFRCLSRQDIETANDRLDAFVRSGIQGSLGSSQAHSPLEMTRSLAAELSEIQAAIQAIESLLTSTAEDIDSKVQE